MLSLVLLFSKKYVYLSLWIKANASEIILLFNSKVFTFCYSILVELSPVRISQPFLLTFLSNYRLITGFLLIMRVFNSFFSIHYTIIELSTSFFQLIALLSKLFLNSMRMSIMNSISNSSLSIF